MKIPWRRFAFAAAFSLATGLSSTTHAQTTIYGLTADGQVSEGTPNSVDTVTDQMMVGFSGDSSRSAVVVFQIPVLPAGMKFGTADLNMYYVGRTGTPTFHGDLYGLPYRSSSMVLGSDLYAGASDPNATKIQDDYFVTSLGTSHLGTSATGDQALVDFLNAEYLAGGAGKYVFFRVSPDADLSGNYTRFLVGSADKAGTADDPKLTYTTVPSAYGWGNVQIGAGGYITGIVAQPASPYLMYARTDVGGAYRWEAATEKWSPITDSFGNPNQYNAASIAIDPNNANRVYYAAGMWSGNPYDVYVSNDRGTTWAATGLNKWMQGNGNIRYAGERLMVDPNNSNIVYMGTARDGLWKRTGSTWALVASFPVLGQADYGLSCVAIDKSGGTVTVGGQLVSKYMYVGVYDNGGGTGGIYKTSDGGATWSLMTGGAMTRPLRAEIAIDGTLFATSEEDAVKAGRASSTLTSIAPGGVITYCGLSTHPTNAQIVMIAERKGASAGANNRIWRSLDGGANWTQVAITKHSGSYPWTSWFTMIADVQINPANPSEVFVGDGGGVLRTENIGTSPSDWWPAYDGIEELCPLVLACPPAGAGFLLSGVADAMGYYHPTLSGIPTQFNNPKSGWVSGLDYCESNPSVVARCHGLFVTAKGASYSVDGGATWAEMATVPSGAIAGRIAVSATDSNRFVWMPQGKTPYYTTNRGATWTASTGGVAAVTDEWQQQRHPLCADRVDGAKFYLCSNTSGAPGSLTVRRSSDGGATFSVVGGIPYSGTTANRYNYKIEALPGANGTLYLSLEGQGLYKSTDSGANWTKLATVSGYGLFAFGKSAPGHTNPTIFWKGNATVGGISSSGVFRSDDLAATWEKVSIASQPLGNGMVVMAADRQLFGFVYLGSSGRGVYWGGPQ